jgi:hypothetical protein
MFQFIVTFPAVTRCNSVINVATKQTKKRRKSAKGAVLSGNHCSLALGTKTDGGKGFVTLFLPENRKLHQKKLPYAKDLRTILRARKRGEKYMVAETRHQQP